MNTLQTALFHLAVLTSPVLSAPQPVRQAVETTALPQPPGTPTAQSIMNNAFNGPRPTEAVQVGRDVSRLHERMDLPPEHLTIEIVNSYGHAITTAHASNAGSPTPVGGEIQPGVIPHGTSASFAVPTGWAGNVAMNKANLSITGDVTLLEASFVVADGWDFAVAGVDVSHVNGFTVPITCKCDGNTVAGCKKNLFNLVTRDVNVANAPEVEHAANAAAINPLRADASATSARPFFEPCEGKAYTFPNDHAANSWGECQSGLISCCVGRKYP